MAQVAWKFLTCQSERAFPIMSTYNSVDKRPVGLLDRDEGSLLNFVDFINRADVGMIESGCRTSLATETFQGLGILSYFFRQKLQSHESAEARVLGLIDNTHTAAAELLNDAVVRDDLADHSEMRVPRDASS